MSKPDISVVIPVYNEAGNLRPLFDRLLAAMDATGRPFEGLFTDDGSRDGSRENLIGFHRLRPDHVRVIVLRRNSGQHQAIMAAFERARGDIIVTLDADLQNPPEEIPKLLALTDARHDVVGGCCADPKDPYWRPRRSRRVNTSREGTTALDV